MVESAFYREEAEHALRLAGSSNDPELIQRLREFAQEYTARADALDRTVPDKEPDADCAWWG